MNLWERCFKCGHRLAYASDHCPRCGAYLGDRKKAPTKWPDDCDCPRCEAARESVKP
jgi:rRNA maturation endonuclease Nob1